MEFVVGMITGLILKGGIICSLYLLTRQFYRSRLECLVISWLGMFGVQNLIMCILSFGSRLNIVGVAMGMCVCIIIFLLFAYKYRNKKRICNEETVVLDKESVVILFLFAVLFLALCVRPLFYYDTTEDALIQGMTKLAFFQQHESLFTKYDSLTINTFSNEWLGELNGLYYLVFTGKDMAIAYGNIEIYLFLAVVFVYLIGIYGYRGKHTFAYAFLACTLPVVTGIAMTIKTDLIAIALLPLAVGFLMEYYKSESPELLFVAIVSLGAAAGAKIAVLPAAGLLLIALILYYFKNAKKRPVFPVIFGGFWFAVFCSRYIVNLVQYGNPFQRIASEKATFSLVHLWKSMVGIAGEFNEIPELLNTLPKYSSWNWVVNKGVGYAGYILIFVFLITILKIKKKHDIQFYKYIAMPIIGGLFFFMMSTEWQRWSFRYVAPYVIVALFLCIGKSGDMELRYCKLTNFFACIIILASTMNAVSAFRWGQAFPYTISESYGMTSTEKKLKCSTTAQYQDLVSIDEVMQIFTSGGTGLVFDSYSYPYYQFFGDDHCVWIDLAYDEDKLIEQAYDKDYDFYVIATTKEDTVNYKKAKAFFCQNGCNMYETSNGLIFVKNR